ncbi:MAG: Ig-like domain-containing protein [Alphaproteobacteria bacterium]
MENQDNETLAGVNSLIYQTLNEYNNAQDISDYYLNNTDGLNISTDVSSAIQSSVFIHDYWNNVIEHNTLQEHLNPSQPVNFADTVLDSTLIGAEVGTAQKVLNAYKDTTIPLAKKVINEISVTTKTIETVFVEAINESNVYVYYDKVQQTIIRSETIAKSSIYIPIGEFLSGAAKAIGSAAIVYGFKDAIQSTYEAATSPGDITAGLQALSDVSYTGGATVAGLAVEAMAGGGISGGAAGGFTSGLIMSVRDPIENAIGQAVFAAWEAGKDVPAMLEDVEAAVQQSVNEFWGASGQDAVDNLQGLGQNVENYYTDLQDINSQYNTGNSANNENAEPITDEILGSLSDLEKDIIRDVASSSDDSTKIYEAEDTVPVVVYDENGNSRTIVISVADASIKIFETEFADAKVNGIVISQASETVTRGDGSEVIVTETVFEDFQGQRYVEVHTALTADSILPANGVFSETVTQKIGEGYTRTTQFEKDGLKHQTKEFQEAPDSNVTVQHNLLQADENGDLVALEGATYVIPSADLLVTLQTVGSTAGGLLANHLADDDVYQQIFYSAALKTIGTHFGSVGAFLATGSNLEALINVFRGVDVPTDALAEMQISADIMDTFASNLQGAVSGALAGVIVDEVGEALGIDGTIGGEVFNVAAGAVTTGVIDAGFGLLFNQLDGGQYANLLNAGFDFSAGYYDPTLPGGGVPEGQFGPPAPNTTVGDFVQTQVFNAVAAYAGNRLAGELIEAESETAAIFGSFGSALGSAIGAGSIGSASLAQFITLGAGIGPIGIAIGAFIGTLAGTVLGNMFGGNDKPAAAVEVTATSSATEYSLGSSWSQDGGDVNTALAMAEAASEGVNRIIEMTGGAFRRSTDYKVEIGFNHRASFVSTPSVYKEFESSGEAIKFAALQLLKNADIVGGHAILMRAWHNSEAETLEAFQEDLSVAEAFQMYLLNPTSILALMMENPDSEAAQQWAAILQRAAELELHLPHEKDIDGGWGELLAARGDIDPEGIPEIIGNDIVMTDPITGEQITLMHVIGPGYEIVYTEGSDGIDNIQVLVDGPSITYTDAGPGDDVFIGHDGSDIFVGGDGDDTANGGAGDDWLIGNAGDDALYGEAGDDLLIGGPGDDILIGGGDIDTIYGGDGDDYIEGNEASDYLYGGNGDDEIHGNGGSGDRLYGGNGNDILSGNHGQKLYGGKGNDTFHIANKNNTEIHIGRDEGHDVIYASRLDTNIVFAENISLNEIFISTKQVYGRSYNYEFTISILGEDQSIKIYGSQQLSISMHNGRAYNDRIYDSLFYDGMGENPQGRYNTFSEDGYTSIFDSPDSFNWNNYRYVNVGGGWVVPTGASVTNGTELSYGYAHSYRTVLGNGDDQYDARSSWVNRSDLYVYGDAGDDSIIGGSYNDILVGGLGKDYLNGYHGDDEIYGGHNNDTLVGNRGNDRLFGGHGNDRIELSIGDDEGHGGDGNDYIIGWTGNDLIYGDAGDDTIIDRHDNNTIYGGDGNDTIDVSEGDGRNILNGDDGDDLIKASQGADRIHGGNGQDEIYGNDGDDWIYGDGGDDIISGGKGDDTISGGDGDDLIYLDGGQNTINGGAGSDAFIIGRFAESIDTIGDFEISNANEKIDLSAFDDIFLTFSDLKPFITQSGTHTEISLPDNQKIILLETDHSALTREFFIGNASLNSTPVAADDTLSTNEDTAIVIDVLGNDVDLDGDTLTLTAVGAAANGSAVLHSDNTITYTPDAGFVGVDSFTYNVSDGNGGTDTATVQITVNQLIIDNDIETDEIINDDNPVVGADDSSADSGRNPNAVPGDPVMPEEEPSSIDIGDNDQDAADALALTPDAPDSEATLNNGRTPGTVPGDPVAPDEEPTPETGEDIDDASSALIITMDDIGYNIISPTSGGEDLYTQRGLDDLLVFDDIAHTGNTAIGFNAAEDHIDISGLLTGYDPLQDAITDFIQISDNDQNSILSIDPDGGADNFVQITTFTQTSGLTDEALLETNGTLITI